MNLDGKTILVTGGTGSFGRKFIEIVLKRFKPAKIVVFSRDELKQFEMQREFHHPCMRYFIGDVRDAKRLQRAFHGVDVVVHTAALKQVPAAEYNPFEAVSTNVIGAENVINAAIDNGVPRVVALSSDKAVNPVNMYGATKLCADKMFIAGYHYAAGRSRFSVVRYGNVLGSRGSVVLIFREQRKAGKITITDERMTRFWISLEQAVDLVIRALDLMEGGEIFVPKIPSMKIADLADAIAPDCRREIIGIRPGEKLHEVLIPRDEVRRTIEFDEMYVILPEIPGWKNSRFEGARSLDENFEYSSHTNAQWLTVEQLKKILGEEIKGTSFERVPTTP